MNPHDGACSSWRAVELSFCPAIALRLRDCLPNRRLWMSNSGRASRTRSSIKASRPVAPILPSLPRVGPSQPSDRTVPRCAPILEHQGPSFRTSPRLHGSRGSCACRRAGPTGGSRLRVSRGPCAAQRDRCDAFELDRDAPSESATRRHLPRRYRHLRRGTKGKRRTRAREHSSVRVPSECQSPRPKAP